jgi:hypothetical protein
MKSQALHQYEVFYEMMKPAEENNQESFAWFSDVPHWLFNAVMHLSCEDVAAKVDELISSAPPKNPLSFWLHPQNKAKGLAEILIQRGFAPIITCPLMSWTVTPIHKESGDIRAAQIDPFLRIVDHVYQFDKPVRTEFEKIMRQLECENYLVYQDDLPVGTGTLLVKDQVGGIFNDATLLDRREASEAMMQFLMKRAYELGLKQVVLLSSPEAEQTYKSLGFKTVFDIEVYARNPIEAPSQMERRGIL